MYSEVSVYSVKESAPAERSSLKKSSGRKQVNSVLFCPTILLFTTVHYGLISCAFSCPNMVKWPNSGKTKGCKITVQSLMELHHRSCILKKQMAKLFKIVVFNPFQSSPRSAILVPFCLRITPLVFFFLSKPLFLTVI